MVPSSTEAERQEHINKASGEAAAIIAVADARARSLLAIAKSLSHLVSISPGDSTNSRFRLGRMLGI